MPLTIPLREVVKVVNDMFLEELAYRLRTARRLANLSQISAAKKAGISTNVIGNLESKRGGHVHSALAAMKAYGMNVVDSAQVIPRLRYQRIVHDMTQVQLSTLAGMHKGQVNQFERETSGLSLKSLIRLCDAMGIDAWTILEDVSE